MFDGLEAKLTQAVNAKVWRAEGIMETAAEFGAEVLREALLAEPAWTRTGLEREKEVGGEPGRYETGTMYHSIATNADKPIIDNEAHTTILKFGWFEDTYQAYFREQDLGVGGIPAANAMVTAATETIGELNRDLAAWAKEKMP